MLRKFKFYKNLTRITGALNEDKHTLWSYDQISLKSSYNEKRFGQTCKQTNTHILYSITFFSGDRAVYELNFKNTAELDMPQMTILLTHLACWISKATNTHADYVIPISFRLQLWLHESACMLRCMPYCLSFYMKNAHFRSSLSWNPKFHRCIDMNLTLHFTI
jgi:hypothetical protein